MNLKPVTLFNLQTVDPGRDPQQKKIFGLESLTISKKRVALSKKLYEKLGQPEKVEFAIDAEKNLLGIRVADPESKFWFAVYPNKGSGYVSGGYLPTILTNHRPINLNTRYMVLMDPWNEEGYCLFDIDKAYVKKIEKRK